MDWDKLKIFHVVAEAGNFTKATYILNLSQSAYFVVLVLTGYKHRSTVSLRN